MNKKNDKKSSCIPSEPSTETEDMDVESSDVEEKRSKNTSKTKSSSPSKSSKSHTKITCTSEKQSTSPTKSKVAAKKPKNHFWCQSCKLKFWSMKQLAVHLKNEHSKKYVYHSLVAKTRRSRS